MPHCYKFPRPSVTTDVILINHKQQLLLIKRLNEPFKDYWAFPGGFVDENEDLKPAALRELKEETSIVLNDLIQFKTYGTPGRDPRGHCVSVVFYKLIQTELKAIANDDAKEAMWFDLRNLPELAFDHKKIINDFLKEKKQF